MTRAVRIEQQQMLHQYIERSTGQVVNERLYSDGVVRWLYSDVREKASILYHLALSRRVSKILGFLNYDLPLGGTLAGNDRFLQEIGINFDECMEKSDLLDTRRKIFERKIRYWEIRPMPECTRAVVSPADSRVLVGSFDETSAVFIKGKFFEFEELLGRDKVQWLGSFDGGDFAIFRLTPEKYHYNHLPVSGAVRDFYTLSGDYHACNPSAVVTVVTPYSKNMRTITVIDTDVSGGTGVGLVAMIEVVALMIGEITQCYSRQYYDEPQMLVPGMFLERGCPKSLYRPGSSTDVLVFQRGRISFDEDLVINRSRNDVQSRFSAGFRQTLVETEIALRSQIARAIER